jgi:hypothetical protein
MDPLGASANTAGGVAADGITNTADGQNNTFADLCAAAEAHPCSGPANGTNDTEVMVTGSTQSCIAVTHPASFPVDLVVRGYPDSPNTGIRDSLVGYDVVVTAGAPGLTVTEEQDGSITILGGVFRTLVSADPQSASLFVATADVPPKALDLGYNKVVVDLGGPTNDADENLDGEENSDGYLMRLTLDTSVAGPIAIPLTLTTATSFVLDADGEVTVGANNPGLVVIGDINGDTAVNATDCVGSPPTADPKPGESTTEDTPVDIILTGSDADECELTFAAANLDNGTVGSVTDAACVAGSPNTDSATITFTPAQDACDTLTGSFSFTYTTNDGTSTSLPAAVDIAVSCVNDAPVAGAVAMDVLVNSSANGWGPGVTDPDCTGGQINNCPLGDAVTCSIVDQPTNGTATVQPDCTGGSYSPDAGFLGTDSFTYMANDGTADSAAGTVTATVAVGATPSPPAGGGTATPTGTPTGSPTPTPTSVPATGSGIGLGGGGSGVVFLALGVLFLMGAGGAIGYGMIQRRRANLSG